MKKYIISLDQGTTISRAILFDKNQNIVASAHAKITQYYPKPGWVEHDPIELFATQSGVLNEVIAKAGISPSEIDSIGITNQRETTIIWNKKTGIPIYNAIVWQCRRTQNSIETLKEKGLAEKIKETTGLVLDAYFSGTKIKWILDNVSGARRLANQGELLFGTVDTWLIYRFTGGKNHLTDVTNASRTMLFDIKKLKWDQDILNELEIPKSMLPEVKQSSDSFGFVNIQGFEIPITAAIGDQQASLYGQGCTKKGSVKNTYGTGGFILMNTKEEITYSKHGLITTIALGLDNKVDYAIEGSIFNVGSTIGWLKDEIGILNEAEDSEYFASKLLDNGGVYLVPAFSGLGAPYWNMAARGAIFGLTRGTTRNHLIRAALESIAYQSYDVLKAMEKDANLKIKSIQVDGAVSQNDFIMQFQADIFNREVIKKEIHEATALGACRLAGLKTGFFTASIDFSKTSGKTFKPQMDSAERKILLKKWHQAIMKSMDWV